jgi:dienelactone hydrolase
VTPMSRTLVRRLGVAAALALVVGGAACSPTPSQPPYEVTSTTVSDSSTREITAWRPVVDGPWPTVVAIHGFGGARGDLDELAGALAAQGMVVFAPDYETASIEQDIVCAIGYARAHTSDQGGDPTSAFAVVGHSLGGAIALLTLNPPPGAACESPVVGDSPDMVFSVAGCPWVEEPGEPPFDPAGYGSPDVPIVLVAAEDDEVCPVEQTDRAAIDLRANGHFVTVVRVPGGHFDPIFHDVVDGRYVLVPDDPAGVGTVQAVVDGLAGQFPGPP